MKKYFVLLLLFAFVSAAFAAAETRAVEWEGYDKSGRLLNRGSINITQPNYTTEAKFREYALKELPKLRRGYAVMKISKIHPRGVVLNMEATEAPVLRFKTEKEFTDHFKLTHAQFIGQDKITKGLDLNYVYTLPDGFNPTADDYVDLILPKLEAIPNGFSPTLGKSSKLSMPAVTSIPQGFNPTVPGGSLELDGVTAIPEGFSPIVNGNLTLGSVTTLPKNFAPQVSGNLDLHSVTSLPAGWEITVGEELNISGVKTLPAGLKITAKSVDISGATAFPKDMKINMGNWDYIKISSKLMGSKVNEPVSIAFGEFKEKFMSSVQLSGAAAEFCKKHGINAAQFIGEEKINAYLRLSDATSLPDGFNPNIIGNDLDLSGLKSLPVGFNPIVEGKLTLSGLTSVPQGFSPTANNLILSNVTTVSAGFAPKVKYDLDLSSVTSLPAGSKIEVEGVLRLDSLTSAQGVQLNAREIYLNSLEEIPQGLFMSDGIYINIPDGSMYVRDLKK